MEIREVAKIDLDQLLSLYTQLHDNPMPARSESLDELWNQIIIDKNHHIIAGFVDNQLVSSCVIMVIPNLTHGQQPYALVENVITHKDFCGKGYASSILDFAKSIAIENNCYKIMLLTGSKQERTLNFYKRAGYNCKDKTAFIQWL